MKLRALFDCVVYRNEAGDTLSFAKGEIADVPNDQAERHLELGAVEKVSAKDAKAASAAAENDAAPDPDELTTPAGDPVGDGKKDVDA